MTKNEVQVYQQNNLPANIKNAAWLSLGEESRKAYQSDYELFFHFVNKDVAEINAEDILKYIEYLETNEYKNNSINRKIASLSKMFKIMVMAGEIKQNPVDVLKQLKNISHKTSREVRVSLTIEDIHTAVKMTAKSSDMDRKTALIIRMLAQTGLRISEMINIENRNIERHDDKNYIIRITGKGKKERFIYMDDLFFNELKKAFPDNPKTNYLFYTSRNSKYQRQVLWAYIHKFFKDKINKNVHPHLLRHFFATYKINIEKQDIKAVSKFLGHSDVSTTLNAYVDTALDVKTSKIKI